jgi:hypothetical protein
LEIEECNGTNLYWTSAGAFVLKVKKCELSYSRMFYNVPDESNIFGTTTSLNEK